MVGSARMARCCGFTVTHARALEAKRTARMARVIRLSLSEVHAEAAGIGLGVLVGLRSIEAARDEDGKVRHLESEQDSPAQSHEQPSPRARHVIVALGQNKRVCVRK